MSIHGSGVRYAGNIRWAEPRVRVPKPETLAARMKKRYCRCMAPDCEYHKESYVVVLDANLAFKTPACPKCGAKMWVKYTLSIG